MVFFNSNCKKSLVEFLCTLLAELHIPNEDLCKSLCLYVVHICVHNKYKKSYIQVIIFLHHIMFDWELWNVKRQSPEHRTEVTSHEERVFFSLMSYLEQLRIVCYLLSLMVDLL